MHQYAFCLGAALLVYANHLRGTLWLQWCYMQFQLLFVLILKLSVSTIHVVVGNGRGNEFVLWNIQNTQKLQHVTLCNGINVKWRAWEGGRELLRNCTFLSYYLLYIIIFMQHSICIPSQCRWVSDDRGRGHASRKEIVVEDELCIYCFPEVWHKFVHCR